MLLPLPFCHACFSNKCWTQDSGFVVGIDTTIVTIDVGIDTMVLILPLILPLCPYDHRLPSSKIYPSSVCDQPNFSRHVHYESFHLQRPTEALVALLDNAA
jgi:hypothetical protein